MSAQLSVDDLLQRINDTAKALNQISVDLTKIAEGFRALTTQKPQQTPKPAAQPSGVDATRNMFPPELEDMLNFEDKGEYVKISPKQFLGSENFAKIASTVRGIGGEYVSAGRGSHFRVYKAKKAT